MKILLHLLFLSIGFVGLARPDSTRANIHFGGRLNFGTSFFLGNHKNAKVLPNRSVGVSIFSVYPFSGPHFAGLQLGLDIDYQTINGISDVYSVNYTRKMNFFNFGLLYEYQPEENQKWHFSGGILMRYLMSGSLLKPWFQINSKPLSNEELYIEPYRRWTPALQMGVFRKIFMKNTHQLFLGINATISAGSLDYKYQKGTLNQLQLSLKFRL